MSVQKIALLGTGLMGAPMARNLCQAGVDTTVWNRTTTKAEPLSYFGATVAQSAAGAVAQADIVISMLSDGPTGVLVQSDPNVRAKLKDGAIWVEMGSIKPEEARTSAADLAQLGVGYVDAPVSGGTKGAEEASLAIMAGGSPQDFATVKVVLNALGRPVHVGPLGAGQLAKLANQAIVAVTIAAVAEAMLMLQNGGADPAAVRAALKGGFADSTILQQHGARMTTGDFTPGGLSELQLKDLNNALAEAESFGLSLPTLINTRDRFQRLVSDLGGAKLDHSALYLELRDLNGLVEV
ncbi:MAG: NAD(P)-dependent oxidoreductase [Planktomarina sp.]|jgi:2-hydroxy-3-oxopropionate reductase|nr:NAD(P)-dependent oxidoreductase [Planktomarina sp.]MDT2057243.1 NAD(P)-dependent oxidoreductase [Planktomarina sp.]HAJ85064.1 2-hydroxy-3-oxopropionate reductase [Paracoccaceae bacterium]|tara:strand:- start:207 stop:1094 length:888 start_codon:yes stop_codon:yes gene_type:complete